MSDATLRIKNLSIALEAISRVAQCSYYKDVEDLLWDEIKEFKKEKEKENQWPQRGPTRTSTTNTDDIPQRTKA